MSTRRVSDVQSLQCLVHQSGLLKELTIESSSESEAPRRGLTSTGAGSFQFWLILLVYIDGCVWQCRHNRILDLSGLDSTFYDIDPATWYSLLFVWIYTFIIYFKFKIPYRTRLSTNTILLKGIFKGNKFNGVEYVLFSKQPSQRSFLVAYVYT